jgi:hypothetical protein
MNWEYKKNVEVNSERVIWGTKTPEEILETHKRDIRVEVAQKLV